MGSDIFMHKVSNVVRELKGRGWGSNLVKIWHLEISPTRHRYVLWDDTRSIKEDKAPRGAYLAHVFPSDPHRPKTPTYSPGGNQGYPSSGANADTQGAYLPVLFILSHTDKQPRVSGDIHLERPLDAAGIQGAPAKLLPVNIFSSETHALLAVSCHQFKMHTKDIAL